MFSSDKFVLMKDIENYEGYILGTKYSCEKEEEKKAFKKRTKDLIRCTYREGYEYLGDTYLSSDAGWGCTIRATQMMIVNSLVLSIDRSMNVSRL